MLEVQQRHAGRLAAARNRLVALFPQGAHADRSTWNGDRLLEDIARARDAYLLALAALAGVVEASAPSVQRDVYLLYLYEEIVWLDAGALPEFSCCWFPYDLNLSGKNRSLPWSYQLQITDRDTRFKAFPAARRTGTLCKSGRSVGSSAAALSGCYLLVPFYFVGAVVLDVVSLLGGYWWWGDPIERACRVGRAADQETVRHAVTRVEALSQHLTANQLRDWGDDQAFLRHKSDLARGGKLPNKRLLQLDADKTSLPPTRGGVWSKVPTSPDQPSAEN